ncbi:cyanophycin synthetase [Caenimonas koreensis DSM 17982]|uniref:Cyanophycin synthetase n=1 Tax=Caenimonas koreensis DSM 17982 TaxID=1121255 RepID=A0A844B7R6_9BURK|nr:Mur ligase family protein [Caenimonas koreensis]MRD46581.1 cyanophycin synthetase [Caenimonas koreensis DSM 17982]
MKIVQDAFYRGANIWAAHTGVLLTIECDEADAARVRWKPSAQQLELLVNTLRPLFPVMGESHVLAQPAGLVTAQRPLIALTLAVCEVLVRDFVIQPRQGRLVTIRDRELRLFIPCDDHPIGLAALRITLAAMDMLVSTGPRVPGTRQRLAQGYEAFRRMARVQGLNQTTLAMARGAVRRGIPVQRLAPPAEFVQLGQGHLRQRISETAVDRAGPLSNWLASDKHATATVLGSLGVPTTQPVLVTTADEAVAAWRRLGGERAVIKPRAAGKGAGVSVNLHDEESVRRAFEVAHAINRMGVLVERFIEGFDHRLLVVGSRLVAVASRRPPRITGDGQHTVTELIAALNADPRRGMPFEKLMERVEVDEEVLALVRAAGLSEASVPEAGRTIVLRGAANISLGGTAVDLTDECHPDNRALAERVALTIGVGVTGIDFMTPDISQSWRDVPCAILEVNATPGLRPHIGANPGRDVISPMIDYLFPDGADGRIPTAGITGSVGKTTTTQLVGALLAQQGLTVGVSTTQGMFVGGECLRDGDMAGGTTASHLLTDPRVQACAFEFARGGLVRKGLVLESLDVGAVLNIHDNHLGLDGITSREELARVKRLVVEHARKLAVLNADEPLCLAMRDCVKAPVALFSEQADNPALRAHVDAGGIAAWLEGSGAATTIHIAQGQRLIGEMAARDLPSTWGGAYRPAAINAMTAALIAHGLGVAFSTIDAALRKFQSNEVTNPGRMNFVEGLPFKLLLTWCDGQHPTREVATLARTIEVTGKRRFMVCAVGNRPDDFVVAMGAAAAHGFDEFVVADWSDLRGRKPLVIARLLAKGLLDAGVDADRIIVAPDHHTAVVDAFSRSKAGDLLVVATYVSEATRREIPELMALT